MAKYVISKDLKSSESSSFKIYVKKNTAVRFADRTEVLLLKVEGHFSKLHCRNTFEFYQKYRQGTESVDRL